MGKGTLKFDGRCASCGETLPAGSEVEWRAASYQGASGEIVSAAAPRSVMSHVGICPKFRRDRMSGLIRRAREAHENARAMLFMANDEGMPERARERARKAVPKHFSEARGLIQNIRMERSAIAKATGGSA